MEPRDRVRELRGALRAPVPRSDGHGCRRRAARRGGHGRRPSHHRQHLPDDLYAADGAAAPGLRRDDRPDGASARLRPAHRPATRQPGSADRRGRASRPHGVRRRAARTADPPAVVPGERHVHRRRPVPPAAGRRAPAAASRAVRGGLPQVAPGREAARLGGRLDHRVGRRRRGRLPPHARARAPRSGHLQRRPVPRRHHTDQR